MFLLHMLPLCSCPASAGAAETANGAVERMVLLGLTSRIIPNFAVRDSWLMVRLPAVMSSVARSAKEEASAKADGVGGWFVQTAAQSAAILTNAQRQAYTEETYTEDQSIMTFAREFSDSVLFRFQFLIMNTFL